jgi:pyruvate/2-oxoglutarate dehydrogenase complex dihydrolipoamide dehydrogenase (E3) component
MAAQYDLVIVGMGSAGLTAAEFASTLGLRVAAVERDRVGGDCLWTGCVPSKALLASAKAAHHMRHADRWGLGAVDPAVDTARVWSRIRAVQQEIAATDDSPERYAEMGVELIHGPARLTGPTTLSAGDRELATRYILLCTGSRPFVPPIAGLEEAGFLTSENVFELDRAPESVIAIGGGPIAIELSQAFTRLGVPTTVLQREAGILTKDEPELVAALTGVLRSEGVELICDAQAHRVEVQGGLKAVHASVAGQERTFRAHAIFVGAGRRPGTDGLGLEAAGVELTASGSVKVDARLRTSVPTIYACGDLAGRFLFTHSAGAEAAGAVRTMFFPGWAKAPGFVPWTTFTDPELAHSGLTLAEAQAEHGADACELWRQDLVHSDRARADGQTEGAIMIVTAKKRIVGAHILAPAAGEMIHELALAISQGMKLDKLASLVHVYPTVAIGVQQLAAEAAYDKAGKYRWLVRKG